MQENPPPTPNPEKQVPDSFPDKPAVLPTQLWGILLLAAFILGLGSGYLIWAKPQETRAVAAEQKVAEVQKTADAAATKQAGGQAQVEIPENVKRYDVPIDGNPIYGSDSAPITIIEFSDYQCPFCQRWHNTAWPQIKEKYGDKVRLVFRDFPLDSIHPEAIPAAEAANCAGDQGKYWDYNDLLFGGGKELGTATYNDYAKQLGLNLTTFQQCVTERKYKDEVAADMSYASQLGVSSTPTFFINGLAVVGAQPFETFEQIIDMELAGKIPK